MKKYFVLLVLLAACSSNDDSPEKATETPPEETPENPTGETPEVSTGDCAMILPEKITVDTVIKNTGSDCDCLVQKGGTNIENGLLTIEPGATVRFEQDTDLWFMNQGRLSAVGTADQRITFEAAEPIKGFAYGVYFNNDGMPSSIEYADFKYLGKKDAYVDNRDAAIAGGNLSGPLTLKNTTVSGSDYNGVSFMDLEMGDFGNNTFFGNDGFGLRVHSQFLGKLDLETDYLGIDAPNSRPYISTYGFAFPSVTEDAVWRKLNAPYFVPSAIYIESGDITITEGTKFVFDERGGIKIEKEGSLKVQGTADKPVLFTTEENTTTYWSGIWVFDSPSLNNTFEYAEIRKAGNNATTNGAITMWGPSYLKLSHTTIADSKNWAACLGALGSNTATLEQGEGNVFENNPNGNIVENCK